MPKEFMRNPLSPQEKEQFFTVLKECKEYADNQTNKISPLAKKLKESVNSGDRPTDKFLEEFVIEVFNSIRMTDPRHEREQYNLGYLALHILTNWVEDYSVLSDGVSLVSYVVMDIFHEDDEKQPYKDFHENVHFKYLSNICFDV